MTTQITKTFNPSGSGPNNFTTAADALAYVRALDPVASDVNVTILDYVGINWSQDTGPISSSDTQRIKWTAPAGLGPNELNRSTFNVGTSGITVSLPRLQYGLFVKAGIDFVNINLIVADTGESSSVNFNGHSSLNTFDNQILYCRVRCPNQPGGVQFNIGSNSNSINVADSLIVMEGNNYVFSSTGGLSRFSGLTFVGRAGGLNTSGGVTSAYEGTTVDSCVFIGMIEQVTRAAITNCFSNTQIAPSGTSGITVNTAAGALVVSETSDFRPTLGGQLIGAASESAKGTPDILGLNRGANPDVGAWQRTPASPLPTATITETTVTTTAGNKRRVTITGTTTGTPTSGLASITPTSKIGNNAVAQSNVALTFPTSTTFQAVFSDDTRVGEYNETVTVTNDGGTGSATGAATFQVVGATGVITAQTITGQYVNLSGTTSGSPLSGSVVYPADTSYPDTSSQGPFALALGTGVFTDSQRTLPAGVYLAPVVTFTIAAGTSFPATGGQPIFINGLNGNPQAPEPIPSNATVTGVTVSPSAPTVAGAATQTFTATVSGTNSPSQAVTWSTTIGTINSSGVLTAPATMTSAQNGTVTATSAIDPTKSGTATFTVPAGTVTPVVTSVTVAPSTSTLNGGASQNFTATVAGTGNPSQAVTWSATAGSINSAGAFVAPAAANSAQTVTITATSTFDTSKAGMATVTVPALSTPTVSTVTVSPSTTTVQGGASQAFTANVTGQNNPPTTVTWSASAGSISSIGIFTAPTAVPSAQTVTITATSTFDGSKSGTAIVTVPAMALPTVTSVLVSPAVAAMVGGSTRQFAAQVLGTGSPSQSVTWSASIGTISTTGLYTAPAATLEIAAAVITATSVYDTSKYGNASAIIAAIDVDPTIQQAYLLSVDAKGWLSGNYFDTRGRRARIDKVVGERQVYGIDLNEWLNARGTSLFSATLKAEGVTVDSRAYIINGVVMCWVKGGKADDFEYDNPAPNYLTIHYKCTNGTENEYTIWFDVLPL